MHKLYFYTKITFKLFFKFLKSILNSKCQKDRTNTIQLYLLSRHFKKYIGSPKFSCKLFQRVESTHTKIYIRGSQYYYMRIDVR